MRHDDEFRLAPIDDDELGLAPIGDDEADKPVAPDVPYNAGVRLIPVTCSACKTRMYASEDQVGLWKRCPDCDRLTEIMPVAPRFMLVANDAEAAGGYGVQLPEVSRQDILQLRAENQKALGEFREEQNRHRLENRLPPPVFFDKEPVMEGMLNQLLKSNDEKNEEKTLLQQEQQIAAEIETIKKVVRNGKLEEYLAGSADPAERKRIEKQRQFESATTSPTIAPPVLPPPLPPVLLQTLSSKTSETFSPPSLTVFPPPPPNEQSTDTQAINVRVTDNRQAAVDGRIDSSDWQKRERQKTKESGDSKELRKSRMLWTPLLDARCRSRMVVLTICGLLGNLTGEKARSMIWQIVFDKVHGQFPGYSYNLMESGFFIITFWLGAVLSVVWLALLFLFGISIFLETADGKDRVENWIPFNLDFGLSYIGWSFLIFFISGFPGFILWQIASFFLPDKESQLILLHFAGQFLCFPVLFLCIIESDTFYGNFPKKTLASLCYRPGLWLRLYVNAAVLSVIPVTLLAGLFVTGTAMEDHWFMHSPFYYLAASLLLTFCGYFVIFYFRLLGQTAKEII
jgi:hypothetical protein